MIDKFFYKLQVCLHNLRKTFKYGGRKNVPSIEEITAISAGRNSKRQIYRLPGGKFNDYLSILFIIYKQNNIPTFAFT